MLLPLLWSLPGPTPIPSSLTNCLPCILRKCYSLLCCCTSPPGATPLRRLRSRAGWGGRRRARGECHHHRAGWMGQCISRPHAMLSTQCTPCGTQQQPWRQQQQQQQQQQDWGQLPLAAAALTGVGSCGNTRPEVGALLGHGAGDGRACGLAGEQGRSRREWHVSREGRGTRCHRVCIVRPQSALQLLAGRATGSLRPSAPLHTPSGAGGVLAAACCAAQCPPERAAPPPPACSSTSTPCTTPSIELQHPIC